MSIFQACDIRGIAGQDLTEEIVRKIALAVGVKLTGQDVVVGGDIRLSTPGFQRAVVEALAESGCRVYDIGTVATPVFYYALKSLGAFGGVMITASHNPAPYNGLKLVLGPEPVTENDIADIERLTKEGTCVKGEGEIIRLDIVEEYIRNTAAQAKKNNLRIVVDAGNGATALIAPRLFREVGYDVVELYCTPDGHFPNRPPNPALAENLANLGEKVRESKAVLGIAFDGDGDRVGVVDEIGRAVDNDDILVLISRQYLSQGPGTVIYDAKCSMVVPEEIVKAGGRAVMARAGHTFSKAAFRRENAVFAGEISGHFFFRELSYDDGMFAGLKIAQLVAEKGSLSGLAESIPNYILTPDIRVPYHGKDKEAILQAVAERLVECRPNLIDGVRIEFSDGWGMIRASVTEPLFTLRFEAKNQQRLSEIEALLLGALPPELAASVRAKMQELAG